MTPPPDDRTAASKAHPTIDDVLACLDEWRHLPAYRLESRADPFFAVFMRDILAAHFGNQISTALVPEFPLRKGSLWPNLADDPKQRNLSVKVDYLAFDDCLETAYLVELKTDVHSRREGQDAYLKQAVEVGFPALVQGIATIAGATSREYLPKYWHLLQRFIDLGFLSSAEELDRLTVLPKANNVSLRVVYVQPLADPKHDAIDFEKVAATVQSQGELGDAFARYLLRWRSPAGQVPKATANTPAPHAKSIVSKDYRERVNGLQRSFPAAFDFLRRIESEGEPEDLWIRTAKNAHLYKGGSFLMYMRLLAGEEQSTSLLLSPRYNLQIVDGTNDRSDDLFPRKMGELLAQHNGPTEWASVHSNGDVELMPGTPPEFFVRVFDTLVAL